MLRMINWNDFLSFFSSNNGKRVKFRLEWNVIVKMRRKVLKQKTEEWMMESTCLVSCKLTFRVGGGGSIKKKGKERRNADIITIIALSLRPPPTLKFQTITSFTSFSPSPTFSPFSLASTSQTPPFLLLHLNTPTLSLFIKRHLVPPKYDYIFKGGCKILSFPTR